jgi:hypothetical protein
MTVAEFAAPLLDHLVSNGEQRRRHLDAKRPRGLLVDNELKLGRPYYRQVSRLLALKNAADIVADLAILIRKVRIVTYQPAGIDKPAIIIDCRYTMMGR